MLVNEKHLYRINNNNNINVFIIKNDIKNVIRRVFLLRAFSII